MKPNSSFLRKNITHTANLLIVIAAATLAVDASAQPPTASLTGKVVEDVMGNGVGPDDKPISGRVIHLFRDNGDGVFNTTDTLVKNNTTGRDGTYSFKNLAAGTYFVLQELPKFWVQTEPGAPLRDEIITPAQCGPAPREPNDTIATAILTGLSSAAPGPYVARGTIGDNNHHELDVDIYQVQADAGSLLQVDIDAVAFGSSLDSVLRIFDATGHPVACDDDAIGGGADSHLEYYVLTTGTYYIGVSCFINGLYDPFVEGSGNFASSTGDYTIQIRNVPHPTASPLAVTLTAGEQRTGADLASSRLGAITGQLFVDTNGNGKHDPGEPGWDGLNVFLDYRGTLYGSDLTRSIDLNHDGKIDPATESGWYSFESLTPAVCVMRTLFAFGGGPAGWMQVFPSLDPTEVPCVGMVSNGPASPPTVPGLLPDLTVDIAHGLCDWFVVGNTLYFGQATPNIGSGPMQLVGGPDLGNGSQIVYQRVFQDTTLKTYVDVQAGTFTYHPEHGHIHFDDYTLYSLRQALPDTNGDGIPEVGPVVAGGQKTSFCLVDVQPYDLSLPNAAPSASPYACGTTQQISVGWEDVYEPTTPGQQIDITGLPPGQYWLEAVVDPDNHLAEQNKNNNVGRALITLGLGSPAAPAGAYGVQLASGQTAGGKDFALFKMISISGQVFNDRNANGRQDNKEHGLDSWIVFLDLNGDGVLNNPEGDGLATALAKEPWVKTDNQGNFIFVDRGPVTYPIRLVPQTGWRQTTTNPALIPARSGQNVAGLKFGLFNASSATTTAK